MGSPERYTGEARTKNDPGIFQGTLVTLGPRGFRAPPGPQDRSGCLWGHGIPFAVPLGPLGPGARVPWVTLGP